MATFAHDDPRDLDASLWVAWVWNDVRWPSGSRSVGYLGPRRDVKTNHALFTYWHGSATTFKSEAGARKFIAEHEAKRGAPYAGIRVTTLATLREIVGYGEIVRK